MDVSQPCEINYLSVLYNTCADVPPSVLCYNLKDIKCQLHAGGSTAKACPAGFTPEGSHVTPKQGIEQQVPGACIRSITNSKGACIPDLYCHCNPTPSLQSQRLLVVSWHHAIPALHSIRRCGNQCRRDHQAGMGKEQASNMNQVATQAAHASAAAVAI
jgi:hypothetical protein